MLDGGIGDSSGAAIENLYPALTQCFAIIICGYFAGRMNLISETESKGINTFVGTFSLPSLIFMSLAKLDLSSVNWLFLLSILISKTIVFAAVIIITLLVGRPINFGRAGIFAIFCTQSNDFAIGYPIVAALYKTTHPEYASYLYLMAPISLAILNPISFVLMEIGKRKTNNELTVLCINNSSMNDSVSIGKERCKLIVSVAKSIFLNPIILMTLLGILGNLIFSHEVPLYLGGILEVLGSAFSASALFLLGLRMVGKVHKLRGATLVVPGILIMVKLLVLPLVTREVVSLVHAGSNSAETVDLSTYGFLYGTFPAAPTVFVFATQYSLDVDLIASAMVACTFISAPLMFVSAKMITLTKTDPSQYIAQLKAFTFDISIAGTVACVWVIFVYVLTKKINRLPHRITAYLIVSQLMSCIGAILWHSLDAADDWTGYIQFFFFSVGIYSSRIWTAILAIALLFLQCRSLCFVLKLQAIFYGAGWGVPVLITALLLIFDKKNALPNEDKNPNFSYGLSQAIVAVSLLVLCFVVTVGCLILHQRYRRRFSRYMDLAQEVASNFDEQHLLEPDDIPSSPPKACSNPKPSSGCSNGGICNKNGCGNLPTITEGCSEDSPVIDIEDLFGKGISRPSTSERGSPSDATSPNDRSSPTNRTPLNERGSPTDRRSSNDRTPPIDGASGRGCPSGSLSPTSQELCPSGFGCHGPARDQCHDIIQRYQAQIDDDMELIEEEPEAHDPQILRHIVLLILLLCSMFVGLAISIWTLIMEEVSGIYIELAFLDATLNFGQSLIVFGIFGVDTKEISIPLYKMWRKVWFGANTLTLPTREELSTETKHICDQFMTHHLHKCKADIAQDKRWRLKIYNNVFSGHKFVDWLIEVGLARDRTEAVNYARHLIEGRVLKHLNCVYHFYDRNLLYTFA